MFLLEKFLTAFLEQALLKVAHGFEQAVAGLCPRSGVGDQAGSDVDQTPPGYRESAPVCAAKKTGKGNIVCAPGGISGVLASKTDERISPHFWL